ncbi:transmembrane and immunoglobulin domain-containing protein 1 isoform X1 [Xenopus laevis]|uniref:Ig-like domain-containing protein n=1 Tax=Xenopus laevis TaxID=8355 RepID=A0A974DMQ8_XENLA|nr:transmembrane and immunoglobulin domain-containing protein 1 isoform X1 [Xenopus laevis]XP_018101571.1 transmembrane and immunoglobulin domain-containing protein 1 isoform X2 [Xenopus laevis]XP_041437603.1 transmembrane and immunoglobulin domain-containing protein 1 isoform X1 [Xenopus laevis]OCT94005.1 hypothetical protein XELAEV_18011669mg [Xenopus laevis]
MNLCVCLVLGPLLVMHHVAAVRLELNNKNTSSSLPGNLTETASLKCQVFDNTGDEELIWYRGTRQVDVSSQNNVNSSHICVSPLSTEDNGVSFTCLLKRDNTVKISVILDVKYTPILEGESSVTVEVGKSAQLTCIVKANPQAEMTWKKNGVFVTMEKSRYKQYLDSDKFQLNIDKADKKDAGIYTCVAVANDGNATTTEKTFELVVEDKKDVLPVEAIAAAVVVGALVILFGLFARRETFFKPCMKNRHDTSL